MKQKILVGVLSGMVFFSGVVYAADSPSREATQTSDSVRQAANMDAGNQALSEVIAEHEALIASAQARLNEAQANGDLAAVAALKRMIDYLAEIDPTAAYMEASNIAFAEAPSNTDALDQQSAESNQEYIDSIYNSHMQVLANQIAERNAVRDRAINYARNNYSVLNSAPRLPRVPDGTQATIYAMSSDGIYYYVNAGRYSGVTVNTDYSLGDSNGDYVGNIRIAAVKNTYSVGVISDCYEISVGWTVGNVVTRIKPPKKT